MSYRFLTLALRWLAVVLSLRVLVTILANYPDYFPPNFDSLFLQGREATFTGAYRPAFYVHIFSGPVVLLGGLILLNRHVRHRHAGLHRLLGWVQVTVLLLLVLPSSVVMSWHAFGGWLAGLSFFLLSAATASCASAESRRSVYRRVVEQLAGPAGGLRDRGAIVSASAIPTPRRCFELKR